MGGEPVRLLSRKDCGLCEDLARALRRLRVSFIEVDVDRDERLAAAYGDAVPVLLQGDREIARAPQTEKSLRQALISAGLLGALT